MTSASRAALLALLMSWAPVQAAPPDGMGGPEMLGAGSPSGPPAFLMQVFPPKLVMEHQQEIALRPAQADAIKQAMNETQQQLVDLQWRLDAETEALGKLLATDHVDEAAVLAKLGQVTAIEQQVKKANFTLLVRIKNQLDAQQQAKLRALRPAHPFGPGGRPPPPPP
jgi:Spy/CpxP family protein refolding chaperone